MSLPDAGSTIVMKFGGTSVGDVARIRHVAQIIKQHKSADKNLRIVAVVSAMAGETNKLVALAKSCVAKPAPREMDVLLASGEQVTIALLAMALIECGIPATSLLAQQAGIETDQHYTNARIAEIDCHRVRDLLDQGVVPVVAGFQGIDDAGNLTTLGRGGSDITAVALAASLNASSCYIYTDVAGVYSTDPRVCTRAKLLKQVCHEEMLEMASLGAKVLHPRSVYFAMTYNVPLVVLSSFEDMPCGENNGTWIVKEQQLMEKPVVTGITYRMDDAKLTILRIPGNIQALSEIFSTLAQEGIFIDMITQTGLIEGRTNISFTVPDESSNKALEIAQGLVPKLKAGGAGLDRDIAKVSVVGIGMRYHSGVASRMFEVLAAEDIEVQMIATSEIKISVVVPRKYCEVAVRALHDGFFPLVQNRANDVKHSDLQNISEESRPAGIQ